MTDTLLLESPAKVNLRLEILGKRKDGYHEIRTVFQKISLRDTLHFSLMPGKRIWIETSNPNLPTGKDNLVHQAILSLKTRSTYQGGIRVKIDKRIPLGAGLGGGSSNAATTLRALNQLLQLNLTRKELMTIGATIGADVPFFLLDGSAIGRGKGERLRKIELPLFWYILIYPNFEVSARWAYENSVLTKIKYRINLHQLLQSRRGVVRLLRNDLEPGVSKKHTEIPLMKQMLLASGANGTLMTGSGPTVFGIFFSKEKADEAFQNLRRRVYKRGWEIFQAHSIT